MHPSIDFESVRYKNELRLWKQDAIAQLEKNIKELEESHDKTTPAVEE